MYLAPLTTASTTAKHCDWKCGVEQTVEDTSAEVENTNDGASCRSACTDGASDFVACKANDEKP